MTHILSSAGTEQRQEEGVWEATRKAMRLGIKHKSSVLSHGPVGCSVILSWVSLVWAVHLKWLKGRSRTVGTRKPTPGWALGFLLAATKSFWKPLLPVGLGRIFLKGHSMVSRFP